MMVLAKTVKEPKTEERVIRHVDLSPPWARFWRRLQTRGRPEADEFAL
jgi:hypothetical protein